MSEREMSKLDVPAWLKLAMSNPPRAEDPAAKLQAERRQRASDSVSIRDRLPRFLVAPTMAELGARIRDTGLRAAAREWSLSSGNALLLGETDAGKSTAAGVIYRRLLASAVANGGETWQAVQTMRWVRADNLSRAAREWPLGKGECPDVREAARASILFLDDLGWEQEPRVIASILADRFDAGGAWTIITSGQTLTGIRERYGDAVIKRMLKHGTRSPVIVQAFGGGK